MKESLLDKQKEEHSNYDEQLEHSLCLYIVYTSITFLFMCEMFFVDVILYYYTNNINYYFYVLLFSTSFCKIILKMVARKIDVSNMNYVRSCYNINFDSTRLTWCHYVSMQLFVEFTISLVYFINYYGLFIYE